MYPIEEITKRADEMPANFEPAHWLRAIARQSTDTIDHDPDTQRRALVDIAARAFCALRNVAASEERRKHVEGGTSRHGEKYIGWASLGADLRSGPYRTDPGDATRDAGALADDLAWDRPSALRAV